MCRAPITVYGWKAAVSGMRASPRFSGRSRFLAGCIPSRSRSPRALRVRLQLPPHPEGDDIVGIIAARCVGGALLKAVSGIKRQISVQQIPGLQASPYGPVIARNAVELGVVIIEMGLQDELTQQLIIQRSADPADI